MDASIHGWTRRSAGTIFKTYGATLISSSDHVETRSNEEYRRLSTRFEIGQLRNVERRASRTGA